MSGVNANEGDAGQQAGVLPRPDPGMLRDHLAAGHDLIPLNKPFQRRGGKSIGKAPRDRNWRVRDYTSQNPQDWMASGFNVGIRLRNDQLVVDVDPRNFEGGNSLDTFCKAFSIRVEDYPKVNTGGGGFHLYMSKPADLEIAGKLAGYPGIEFKTAGRQLVAAGSVHPDTKKHYHADDPFSELGAPPSAPSVLLDAISKKRPERDDRSKQRLSNQDLAELLDVLDPTKFKERDSWLKVMMAAHDGTRGAGMAEFLAWSARDPEFADHAESVRTNWNSLALDRPQAVTVATLFKHVADAGRIDLVEKVKRKSGDNQLAALPVAIVGELDLNGNGDPKATFSNCLKVLKCLGLGLAYDELSRRPLLRAEDLPWTVDVGRELNDDMLRVIRHYILEREQIEFSKENVAEACLTLAREAGFNPVVDYLEGLCWDGSQRLTSWLSRYLGASDTPFTRAVGRLTLIGAVRRARHPGCKFDQVLILEGAQGTGKSSALKILGGSWHSDAELGALDGKEAPLVLQGVWIHELGELTAMGRGEVEDLKAFVSRCEDRYRAPYDRMARTDARRCVFIGTTNAETYLFDMTGNRRFWPVKTGEIDVVALGRDRDQIWAEAADAEASGETVELARELWTVAAEEQSSRLATDPWKDQLVDWLQNYEDSDPNAPPGSPNRPDRVHTRDLLTLAIGLEPPRQTQQHAKRVRELMRQIPGWEYRRALRIEGKASAAGYQRTER